MPQVMSELVLWNCAASGWTVRLTVKKSKESHVQPQKATYVDRKRSQLCSWMDVCSRSLDFQ
jgi:hypothetical protein